MGGDKIRGPLTALREAMEASEKKRLVKVLATVEKLKVDLEELGVDVTVAVDDTPPDVPKGVVLHLTAVIREDVEEGPG